MSVARYNQIAKSLQEARSRLSRPLRLPDEVRLAAEHRVARETIRRALRVLEDGGAVTRRRGIGTFLQPVRPVSHDLAGGTIGLVNPWWADEASHSFTATVFDGVSRWADENRCSISMLQAPRRIADPASWLEHARDRNLAGLIWIHPQLAQLPVVQRTAKYLPTVVLGRAYPGTGLHHVIPNYGEAARLIDRCMVEHGHSSYAVVGKNVLEPYTQAWLTAIAAAHTERAATFEDWQFVDFHSFKIDVLPELLLDCYGPTAPNIRAFMFLTSGYLPPLIASERFRQRLESDFSIATIDYGLYPMKAYWPGRQITHVTCDWGAMGRRAVEVLSMLVGGQEAPEVSIEPVGFEPGQTMRPYA